MVLAEKVISTVRWITQILIDCNIIFLNRFQELVIMKLWASVNNVTHGQSFCTKKCFYVWLYWPTLNYEQKSKGKRFLSVFASLFFKYFLPELTLKRDCPEDLEDTLGFWVHKQIEELRHKTCSSFDNGGRKILIWSKEN